MPYDLKELAAISGQPGLYRLVRPARHGVLVESLDAKATRSLAPASNKVSLLSEIGMYTQDSDEPLAALAIACKGFARPLAALRLAL